MKKHTKKEVEPYNVWSDATAPGEVFTHEQMMQRLRNVHGIDPAKIKGQRSMIFHVDGDTWYSYGWEWTIGEKKFHQSTRALRRGMDRQIWAGEA